jgi:hypothetical protein
MHARKRRPRVVLAVSMRAAERMNRVFEGWQVTRPASVAELSQVLRMGSADLVVVGSLFDGSRAIEAVKAARRDAPGVPLVCVRAAPFYSALGRSALAALRCAAEELGADCFIDVLEFPDDAEGNRRVRAMLERLACVA